MKTATAAYPAATPLSWARVADYVELSKPRIAFMALLTVAAGAWLAAAGKPNWLLICHTLFGSALVAAGSSALNQFMERDSDALMRRTERRPLPAGRMTPTEVLGAGLLLGMTGILYLVFFSTALAAAVAALTLVSYVCLYTPLKRYTSLNTLIGAVPGALPPVIGWTAVRGSVDIEILAIFAVMFLWQVPHFLAIAWIHREDYARASMCMLPVVDSEGGICGRQMVAYCLTLIPISLMPTMMGRAGLIYMIGAIVLGLGYLAAAIAFARGHSLQQARGVLRASLIYLPAFFILLLIDAGSRSLP
jgi:protoheme IX farnesyltransferase